MIGHGPGHAVIVAGEYRYSGQHTGHATAGVEDHRRPGPVQILRQRAVRTADIDVRLAYQICEIQWCFGMRSYQDGTIAVLPDLSHCISHPLIDVEAFHAPPTISLQAYQDVLSSVPPRLQSQPQSCCYDLPLMVCAIGIGIV